MGAIGGAMARDGAEGAEVDGRGGEDEARCGSCMSRDVVVAEDETSMDLDAGLRGGLVGAVKARALELVTASGEEVGGEVGLRKVDAPETETGVVRPPEPEERCLAWVPLSEELPLTMMSWSKVMSSRSPAGVERGELARLVSLDDLSSDKLGNGRTLGCGRFDLERRCLAFLTGGVREALGLDRREDDGERGLLMARGAVDDGCKMMTGGCAEHVSHGTKRVRLLRRCVRVVSSPCTCMQSAFAHFPAAVLAASQSRPHPQITTTHNPWTSFPVQTTSPAITDVSIYIHRISRSKRDGGARGGCRRQKAHDSTACYCFSVSLSSPSHH